MIKEITQADYREAIAATPGGVCIVFKELCPHCKNMEKVMEKFGQLVPDAVLLGLDIQKNPEAAAALGAEWAPTLCIIKAGVVRQQKTGLMNPRELLALYQAG
ncbi:MAG: thioredoxin family protein [Solidesulfovibrio sp. DCME]|uniref:thioredoxin family protein n=1 Tax=Solidesulfovibrio sp. DCME TaxID=3447380 RepID=UPI003D11513C